MSKVKTLRGCGPNYKARKPRVNIDFHFRVVNGSQIDYFSSVRNANLAAKYSGGRVEKIAGSYWQTLKV